MSTETLTKKYTIEEFLALPEDGNRYELVEGELVEMVGANEEHCYICSTLEYFMTDFVRKNKLGRVYGSDARYAVVPNKATIRLPNVSFVQASRITPGADVMNFGPDLAIEVLSGSNSYEDIEDKVSKYLGKGGQLVWVINPKKREVYIYRNGTIQRQTLTFNDELDGEQVLSGFKLSVQQLFLE